MSNNDEKLSTAKTGLQKLVVETMKEKGTKSELWNRDDVVTELEVTGRQADNCLYNAWKGGKLCRHKNKTEDGRIQYALDLKPENKLMPDAILQRNTTGTQKRRKGQAITPKEVRTMFVALQNNLARLEDVVMTAIESNDDMEKAIAKVKNLL